MNEKQIATLSDLELRDINNMLVTETKKVHSYKEDTPTEEWQTALDGLVKMYKQLQSEIHKRGLDKTQ